MNLKKLFASTLTVLMVATMFPVNLMANASYSDELQGAYDYAFENGITTMDSIENANMYGTLTRIALAKMISNYAMDVLGLTPDTDKDCEFSDVTASLDEQYDNGVTNACQLGLMGVGIEKFNPYGIVTRAEFGTVLSRALRGDKYNGATPYYADHLSALEDAGVMNNISNPSAVEVRGYVMLMMQRADEEWVATPEVCKDPMVAIACALNPEDDACPVECRDVEDDDYTEVVEWDWDLDISDASSLAAWTTLPVAAWINVGSFELEASADDVIVNSVTLNHMWVWARTDIASVTLFANGQRISKSREISSEDKVELNLNAPFTVKKWSTETFDIVITTAAAAWEHYFVVNSTDIASNAKDVNGKVTTPMFKTSTTNAGKLTFSADWSLSNVKLWQDAILAKFKVASDWVEDITLNAITMKRDTSVANVCSDEDLENLELYVNWDKVATADEITNKFVTFTFDDSYEIEKNTTTVRFEVKWDVVGGAGKKVALVIDSDLDVSAEWSKYGYGALIAGRTNVAQQTTIEAGAITMEKINVDTDRIVKNKTNVEFGSMKIGSAGKDVEVSSIKLSIDSVNDWAAGAFAQIENLELYNSTNGQTYTLTYSAGTTTKVYQNTDLGLIIKWWKTHTLVLRADTKSTATNGDYAWRLANAATDIVIKETTDDTAVTDITPNALSWKKLTLESPALTFSQNALSAAFDAVVGASDVEVMNFNVKASQVEDLRIRELKFKDNAWSTVDNTLVAGFSLHKKNTDGTYSLVKAAWTNQLAWEEITFNNLDITVTKNTTATFKLTVNLVKDDTNNWDVIKMYLSAYDVEDKDSGNNAYDTVADINSDWVIPNTAPTAASARTVTLRSTGSLQVSVDNTDTKTNVDSYFTAGTFTSELATFKLKANNESIKVKDITITSSYSNIASLVSKLYIVNEAGEVLASETNVGQNTTFNAVNLVVPTSTTKWYVKADLNRIGKDLPWVLNQTTLTWSITDIVAEGKDSGTSLIDGNLNDAVAAGEIAWDTDWDWSFDDSTWDWTATAVSKQFGVLAGRMTTVSFLPSYNQTSISLKVGASNLAILKVTTDAHNNTLANGDESKIQLSKVRVKIDRSSTITTNGDITIERIGWNWTTVTATTSLDDTVDANDSYYAEFAISGLGADAELAAGSEVHFLVKTASVGLSATENESLTVSMPDLNGTADTTNTVPVAGEASFEWKDNANATWKAPLRIKGVTSLDGQVARE